MKKVLIILFLIIPYLTGEPLRITVEEGQGFVLRMTHYGGYPDFITCQVEREHNHYNLSAAQFPNPVTLPTGESITHLFYNIQECGVRVHNVNWKSSGNWKLIMYNADGKFTTETTKIEVISKSEPRCGDDRRDICNLSKENKSTWDCRHPNWYAGDRCFISRNGVMDYKSIDVQQEKVASEDLSKGVILKIEHSNIMSCAANRLGGLRHCRITHLPSGLTLNIQDGLQHQRYSAYKTDLAKSLCQLEVPNPIAEDTGIWKMTLTNGMDVQVCEFNLFDAERIRQEFEAETVEVVDVLVSDGTVTLTCVKDMPYPITMCLFQTKNDIIFSHNQEELSKGTCRLQLLLAEIETSVSCGFNGFTKNEPDFYRRFEIVRHNKELEMKQLSKKVLQCRHVFSESLEHCIFESPSRQIFSLSTDTFSSQSFKYYNNDGQRLKDGYCTLNLAGGLGELEDGNWRCIAKKGQQTWQQEINVCINCAVNVIATL